MKSVLAGLAKLKELHSEYKDVSVDENANFKFSMMMRQQTAKTQEKAKLQFSTAKKKTFKRKKSMSVKRLSKSCRCMLSTERSALKKLYLRLAAYLKRSAPVLLFFSRMMRKV